MSSGETAAAAAAQCEVRELGENHRGSEHFGKVVFLSTGKARKAAV